MRAAAAAVIGREHDRGAIAGFFEAGLRLVTIVGPGGVGKTALAARFALDHAAAYAAHGGGGAWVCDLTESRSAMAMCAAVAAAVDVPLDRETSEPRVVAALGRALARRRRLLLVIDNCEHLADEVAATVAAWLAVAAHLVVVATSRVPLGLPGEQLWPLAGLPVPQTGVEGPAAAAAAAVELFVRRAQAVRPTLQIGAEQVAAIAEIVRRLDGMPLAIELAASRVVALSPAQIRDRLALDLLQRPGDTGRHGSMREVIVSSVHALPAEARAAFARCAVFRGGFTMRAAEHVLGDAVHAAIETLCRHSLVRATSEDEPRFVVVETIREVAASELETLAGERARVAERHATYFAAEGQVLGTRARERADRTALMALAADLENLVEAHRWALGAPRTAGLALELALALDPLLATRGMFRLRLRLLDEAIAAGDGTDARAWVARGWARRELGTLVGAREDLQRGLALAAAAPDPELAALAEIRLGDLLEVDGATGEARVGYERALRRLAGAPPSPQVELRAADAHAALGHAWRREGQLAAAEGAIAQALARYRAAQHLPGIAATSYEAAVVALFRQDYRAVHAGLAEALALARALHARPLEAAITSGLGVALQDQRRLDEAISQHAAAVEVFRDLGNRHRTGSALYYLATAYLERGELAEAHAVLAQAAAEIWAVGAMRYQALIEGARGVAHALADDRSLAERAFARADAAAAACRSEPALLATLAIHRLHLAPESRPEAVAAARRHVEAALGDDPRFALRVLAAPSRGPAEEASLRVRADGRAFRPPAGAADVDLARRLPLRRILAALAKHRVDAPGDSLGLDELLAAGWPGERIRQTAGVNRVHVALTTLRKLGLRAVLISGAHGYLLDPAVAIAIGD